MSRKPLSSQLRTAMDVNPMYETEDDGLGVLFSQEHESITPGTETELSLEEADELRRCEQIVERGLKTFFEVGKALMRVRDLRLYRAEYATFQDYCTQRWSMDRTYAHRLIDAASVRQNLLPIGNTGLPDNEAQVRPLARLKNPEQQRDAWERAVTTAVGRITAAHVEQVVKEMLAQFAPDAGETALEVNAEPAAVQPEAADTQTDEAAPGVAATAPQSPSAAAPTHADQQPIVVWVEEDQADADDAAALIDAGEPWPDNLFEIEARLAEEGWERVGESETRISYRRGEEHLRLVKPPDPHVVQLRLVAHAGEDMDHVMAWLQRQIGAEFPRNPTGSRLPKYPERRRVYGAVSTAQQSYVDGLTPVEAAALQARNADLEQKLATVQTIIEEYQEHITKAQKYKATSDRGEAVSPLLRALERVWLELQETARTNQ